MSEHLDPTEGAAKSGIFAVDVRVWRHALSLGINHAVALLVLACGLGGDNTTTSWSTDAVERYTGISRPRAKEAINDLEKHGVLQLVRGGTKPSRTIRPAHEIPNCEGYRGAITEEEQAFLLRLPMAEARAERSQRLRRLCDRVVNNGHAEWADWIEDARDMMLVPKAADQEPKAQWVWLPNSIVTGAANEVPPLELVRQTQRVRTLRMLVEAYHYHYLNECGGLTPDHIHQVFEKEQVGEFGQYRIWRFRPSNSYGCGDLHPLWRKPFWETNEGDWETIFGTPTIHTGYCDLIRLGLAAYVPCIFESERRDAELVYPAGKGADAAFLTSDEVHFGEAANVAAFSMMGSRQVQCGANDIVIPVPAHMQDVSMRGILRMRYRPHTTATARWCAATASLRQVSDRMIAALPESKGNVGLRLAA